MPLLLVLEDQEALHIAQTYDAVSLQGPAAKRLAASIQEKIAEAAQVSAATPQDVVESNDEPQPRAEEPDA